MANCCAFNKMTVKQYTDKVFSWALDDNVKRTESFPVSTAIQFDVAHFIVDATRWDCFKHPDNAFKKRFYVRVIALMVDSQSVAEFQYIFSLACSVALLPFDDCVINACRMNITVEEARRKLEHYISTRKEIIDRLEESTNNSDKTDESDEQLDELSNERDYNREITKTHQWIRDIIVPLKAADVKNVSGRVPNGHFLPSLINHLERVGKEFVLWTSAAVPHQPHHASTAAQENYFNMLKHGVFEGVSLPTSCCRFLKMTLDDISSDTCVMAAKLKKCVPKDYSLTAPSITPPDLEVKGHDEDFAGSPEKISKTHPSQLSSKEPPILDDSDNFTDMQWRGIKNDYHTIPWNPLNAGSEDSQVNVVEPVDNEETTEILKKFSADDEGINSSVNKEHVGMDLSIPDDDDGSRECPATITPSEFVPQCRKGKEKLGGRRKKAGYFDPYPQIKILNLKKSGRLHRGFLLPNGCVSPIVKQNGLAIRTTLNCGFDSLVHILQFVILDDDDYFSELKSSSNKFIQFIVEFLERGATNSVHQKRCALLAEFYPVSQLKNKTSLMPYTLNAKDNITNIWENFFQDAIGHATIRCTNAACMEETTKEIYYLNVNHKKIAEKGFQELQDAVHMRSGPSTCTTCGAKTVEETTLKNILFIELTIQINAKSVVDCQLIDFPVEMELTGVKYRLVGVIHHNLEMEHYVAYCYRMTGCWTECDDLSQKIKTVRNNVTIRPSAAIYVKFAIL